MNVGSLDVTVNLQSANITPAAFADWLKGFLAAAGEMLTIAQLEQIKQKLATVSPFAGWMFCNPPVAAAPPLWGGEHIVITYGKEGT